MADVTVLVSPSPRFPVSKPSGFRLMRSASRPLTPIMVTLESDRTSKSAPTSPVHSPDESLLSPPRNTWKSKPSRRPSPTRPSSAPPMKTTFESAEIREVSTPVRGLPNRRRSAPFLSTSHYGEPSRPAPPLLRPTTFWRKTKRSGVTGASYSPSSHLIRRSTFIAAGLTFDSPIADISAFCVESRIGFLSLPPELDNKFH